MKRYSFVLALFLVTGVSVKAQNANPFISISINPFEIKMNETTTLEVTAGNAANDKISSKSMEIIINVGSNATISGIATGSDARWKIIRLTHGDGNMIILENTSEKGFHDFDLSKINLTVKGTKAGGPALVTATIKYLNGKASQGNSSQQDDRSTTSLTVLGDNTTKEPVKKGF